MAAALRDSAIVVTGGAGFIGSHIAERLCRDNHVRVIDDLSTGKKQNMASFSSEIDFVEGSVADRDLLREELIGANYVFHLAAIASIQESLRDPLAAASVNAQGTLNVLAAAREARVSRLVLASSCSVYGDPESLPTPESAPLDPLSPYAATKAAAEHYCSAFARAGWLEAVSLRFYNVYGPRQDPRSEYSAVIPRFVARAAAGKPLHIYGSGKQTRDFVYVSDVVDACLLAAVRPGASGKALNVGSGIETSVEALARAVSRMCGGVEIERRPARGGEVFRSVASTSLARKSIGFEAKVPLAKGLDALAAGESRAKGRKRRR